MTTVGGLCEGYGGLSAAVPGAQLAWYAENDPHAAQVLAHHMPHVPNHGDITTIDWRDLEPIDVLTAGYPCQPFSLAGARKGTSDARHLWPYIAEAVRVLRPRHVFLENVAGHRSMGLGGVLGDLAALGYDCRWCSVRACDVGAPHRRERLFILATDTRRGEVGQATLSERGSSDQMVTRLAREAAPDTDRGRLTGGAIADLGPEDAQPEGGPRDDVDGLGAVAWGEYEPAVTRWRDLFRDIPAPLDHLGRLNPPFVEWMMGLPLGWVTKIGLRRTAQLKILGNGVVPQQARLAWLMLTGQNADALPSGGGLLPTPTARDWKGQNQRRDTTCLPGALTSLSLSLSCRRHGPATATERATTGPGDRT